MHIVWLILKILLIVILSLVGLVVLLALLVLFAPVRYRAYVKKDDDIFAKFSARWLGFVLCFKVLYDSDGLRYGQAEAVWRNHHGQRKKCHTGVGRRGIF